MHVMRRWRLSGMEPRPSSQVLLDHPAQNDTRRLSAVRALARAAMSKASKQFGLRVPIGLYWMLAALRPDHAGSLHQLIQPNGVSGRAWIAPIELAIVVHKIVKAGTPHREPPASVKVLKSLLEQPFVAEK